MKGNNKLSVCEKLYRQVKLLVMQSRLFTSVLSTSYSHYDDITLTIIKADTMFAVMEYLT